MVAAPFPPAVAFMKKPPASTASLVACSLKSQSWYPAVALSQLPPSDANRALYFVPPVVLIRSLVPKNPAELALLKVRAVQLKVPGWENDVSVSLPAL